MTVYGRHGVSPAFLAELRERLPLALVVQHHGVALVECRAGLAIYTGRCPFHASPDGSETRGDDLHVFDRPAVQHTTPFYRCGKRVAGSETRLGCGAQGDILGFTMRKKNIGFVDALQELAELAEIPIAHETIEWTPPTAGETGDHLRQLAGIHKTAPPTDVEIAAKMARMAASRQRDIEAGRIWVVG